MSSAEPSPSTPQKRLDWVAPTLRVILLLAAGLLVWVIAGHWNSWTGAARFQKTDDAYVAGDLTPLSAKVSGYVQTLAVDDFQTVHKGDLIAEFELSD